MSGPRTKPALAAAALVAALGAGGLAGAALAPAARADDDHHVHRVRLACGHPADDCDCPPPLDAQTLRQRVRALVQHPGDAAAQHAFRAGGAPVVEALLAGFSGFTVAERAAALRASAPFRSWAWPLAGLGLADAAPEVRAAAVELASRTGARQALLVLATSPVLEERRAAAAGLGRADDSDAPLVALLADAAPDIRATAARSLRRHRTPAVAAALFRTARSDRSPSVRAAAIASLASLAPLPAGPELAREAEAIGAMGDIPEALAPLLPGVLAAAPMNALRLLGAHREPAVRAAVAAAVAARWGEIEPIQRRPAEDLVAGALADPNDLVARAAIVAIGQAKITAFAPDLVDSLRTRGRDDPLQGDVLRALERLSGERLPPSYAAWRRWLDRELPDG